jgi:hypothetical protein
VIDERRTTLQCRALHGGGWRMTSSRRMASIGVCKGAVVGGSGPTTQLTHTLSTPCSHMPAMDARNRDATETCVRESCMRQTKGLHGWRRQRRRQRRRQTETQGRRQTRHPRRQHQLCDRHRHTGTGPDTVAGTNTQIRKQIRTRQKRT